MADLLRIVDEINLLTMSEARELAALLREKWGISELTPQWIRMPMNNLTESIEENRPEEKTEFGLVLLQIGPKKIEVIKTVRRFVSLGLSEAKNLVESNRPTILSGVSKEVVENARISLESVGAIVEVV